ncbi:MAG: serine hydrolase domain-containing protein, partial [Flavobacteriaceae bacterium]
MVLCTGYVWAQDPGGYKDFHEGILPSKKDSVLEKIRQFPDGTELSIAVIHERRPTFYGLKKEKDTIRAVPNFQSAFEIGSITKVFTATLLANFVEDGMVGLNEPINGYFGFVMGDSIPITFKQLASHTSGLPPLPDNFLKWQKDFRDPYREYGEEALKEYFIDAINLDEEDQNKYVYSNLGAGVLGFVLATIGNQD